MLKVKNFFITLAAIVLFSSVSEARVCFLVGSDDEEGCLTATYEIESLKCKGFSLCESPRKGSSVCIDAGNNYYKPEDCYGVKSVSASAMLLTLKHVIRPKDLRAWENRAEISIRVVVADLHIINVIVRQPVPAALVGTTEEHYTVPVPVRQPVKTDG